MAHSKLTLTSDKQLLGGSYENKAERFLSEAGLEIVAKNWLAPKMGEIDLIMIEKGRVWDVLVFVEVRLRSNINYGDALASISSSKKRKLIKVAQLFLLQHQKYSDHECRFDVVGFVKSNDTEQVDWVKGAFLANAW